MADSGERLSRFKEFEDRYGQVLSAAKRDKKAVKEVKRSLFKEIEVDGTLSKDQKKELKKRTEEYFVRALGWEKEFRSMKKDARLDIVEDTKISGVPGLPGVITFQREVTELKEKEWMHGKVTDSKIVRDFKDWLGGWEKTLHSIPFVCLLFCQDFSYESRTKETLKIEFLEDGSMSITGVPMGPEEIQTIVGVYKRYCQSEPGKWKQPDISGFSPEIRFMLVQGFMEEGFTLLDENGNPTVRDDVLPPPASSEKDEWKWYSGVDKEPVSVDIGALAGGHRSIGAYIRNSQHLVGRPPVPTSRGSRPTPEGKRLERSRRIAEPSLEERRARVRPGEEHPAPHV
jgi:hypothetical protein